jgi:hypothetical protein
MQSYHSNDFAIELLIVCHHLAKSMTSSRNTFNEGTRDTPADTDRKYTNIARRGLFADVIKHLLLRPNVAIGKQHEFGWHFLQLSFEAALHCAQCFGSAKVGTESADVPTCASACV